jgi:hypothetical protein
VSYDRDFVEFQARVRHRIDAAESQYGDRSLHDPAMKLLGEIEEEILDINGWSFFLWKKLRETREKFKRLGVV